MNNTFKTILIAAAAALVVVLGFRLVGNNQPVDPNLGANGITRYSNSGIAAKCFTATATPGSVTTCTDAAMTVNGALSIGTSGSLSIGGGTAVDFEYSTTTKWNAALINAALTTKSIASTSVDFILRPDASGNLPEVGDICQVGNPSASSSAPVFLNFNVTAADTGAGFPNASGTLLVSNYGAAIHYGNPSLRVTCKNY